MTGNKQESKGSKAVKILTGSFWVVMAIHLTVFTAVGLFTPLGWRLLILFVECMGILFLVFFLLYLYSRIFPEQKWLGYVPYVSRTLKTND